MDRLDELFRMQAAFDEEVARRRQLTYDPATWVQKEVLAMVSELAEILDEVNFKWWKDPKPVDKGRLTEELVDLLHFFLSTCLKVGIGPDELFEAYRAKNLENFRRIRGESDRPGYYAPPLDGEAALPYLEAKPLASGPGAFQSPPPGASPDGRRRRSVFQRPLILPRRLTFVPWSVTVPFLFLLGCLAGSPWPGAAASWEGQAAWEGEWDGPGPPLHRLLWEAAGPLAPPGWGAAARLVVERPGPAEEDRLAEGRLALTAPALQLQLLYDQAHLASGDPLALISGGRRNPQQPALTLEVASRHWDLTLQGVRQIDNPGPDGDLAAARLQGWWSGGRTALTLFRLETGLLGGVQPPNPANRGLLQELASVEGYVEAGPVEVGLQLVHTRTAGWEQRPLGPVQARGARLVRLRSLPWRPSERLRLEGGLFQTDGGFRSLAAREQRLPPDAAGFWTDLRLRSGPWRWENRFLHARLGGGGHHWEGELRSRLTWGGLTWSAGLEGKRVASGAGLEATQQLELGVGRSGPLGGDLAGWA